MTTQAQALAATLPKSIMAYAHAYTKAWKAEGARGESTFAANRTYARLLAITLGIFWYELERGSVEFVNWDVTC
jgi:hypothetical protein